ncbi:hypothetical protein [Haloferula sargassicola]|uniref:DUF4332 domain-containing protein n=1 Tax=Haloferula sargassicola TaxID=490096 RepID=A0ABP9UJJ2_9BACT
MNGAALDQDLAKIVGNTRRKNRVLSIPDLADCIRRSADALGGVVQLGERVMLSPTMLRQFLSVENLHPSVRALFDNRDLDSVDLCAQLATLDSEDQIVLSREVLAGSLQTKDVRDFRELRKRSKTCSADEILRKVVEAKPQVEFLAEFILRSGDDPQSVENRLLKHLDAADVIRIGVDGSIASLSLTKAGRDRLLDLSKSSGFTLEQTIQMVASGNL